MGHLENSSRIFERTNESLSLVAYSRTEGVAWCSAFAVVSFLVIVCNALTITVFALNKNLRRKSFLLVINMACADFMLGGMAMPLFVYRLGGDFKLWAIEWGYSLNLFYLAVDTVCAQASIITAAFIAGERFYATGWPLKHRCIARRRAYYVTVSLTWVLSIFISSVLIGSLHKSVQVSIYIWMVYAFTLTLIICVCSIGIFKSFTQGRKFIRRQSDAKCSESKRSTKTLLLITFVALACWLPLIVTNTFTVYIPVDKNLLLLANLINFGNSFANPVLYCLRIPNFRRALWCRRGYKGKTAVGRLAVTTTAFHLQVALKRAVEVSGLLHQKEGKDVEDDIDTEMRTWIS
ncbi:adenosine receptor A3-like [Stylophora pistillata]|uniref:adenosine receptor A3-like n=1 Tax=Stylophora pistillata TaxID=50429 RepID=UPI000C043812|nr:adenosine receptor A3-like [Stylophora pistillata]